MSKQVLSTSLPVWCLHGQELTSLVLLPSLPHYHSRVAKDQVLIWGSTSTSDGGTPVVCSPGLAHSLRKWGPLTKVPQSQLSLLVSRLLYTPWTIYFIHNSPVAFDCVTYGHFLSSGGQLSLQFHQGSRNPISRHPRRV